MRRSLAQFRVYSASGPLTIHLLDWFPSKFVSACNLRHPVTAPEKLHAYPLHVGGLIANLLPYTFPSSPYPEVQIVPLRLVL